MSTTFQIRLATPQDAPALQAIYAPYVLETPISFEVKPPTVEGMRERIEKGLVAYPWLVCEVEKSGVVGYVYASKHRERAAYQWGVDVTVYVHPTTQRGGVARGLYTSLLALLRLQGFYNAYAGIALPNSASVGLHEALGFKAIGVYPQTGYKLGKWHDVGWWELALQPHADDPATPRPLPDIFELTIWEAALREGESLLRLQ
jgi:L-amino acid N-acyltransferase YncA